MLAREELVWNALPDVRSPEQREADGQIDRECRDEPDKVERLRQDALAVCSEYFEVVRALQNRPEPICPGCEARALEQVDLVADRTVALVRSWLRDAEKQRKARLRVLASEFQGVLELAA